MLPGGSEDLLRQRLSSGLSFSLKLYSSEEPEEGVGSNGQDSDDNPRPPPPTERDDTIMMDKSEADQFIEVQDMDKSSRDVDSARHPSS